METANEGLITQLSITPDIIDLQVGETAFLKAEYETGLSKKDVTNQSFWLSSSPSVEITKPGHIKANSEGTGTLRIMHRPDGKDCLLQRIINFTVVRNVENTPLDLVILLDHSGSMDQQVEHNTTRWDCALKAAHQVYSELKLADRLAVISFAGTVWMDGDKIVRAKGDTAWHLNMTPYNQIRANLFNQLPRPFSEPLPGQVCYTGATGMGGGLELAESILKQQGRRTQVSAGVLMLTDGLENIWEPDPEIPASKLKDIGAHLAVVAVDVPDEVVRATGETSWQTLSRLTTSDFFFPATTAELIQVCQHAVKHLRRYTIAY